MPPQGKSKGIVYGSGAKGIGASNGLSTDQSIAASTPTTVALDTPEQDPNHWISGDQIVVPFADDYLLNGQLAIVTTDAANVEASIDKNGTPVVIAECQVATQCPTFLDTFMRTETNAMGTSTSGGGWTVADDVSPQRTNIVPGLCTLGPMVTTAPWPRGSGTNGVDQLAVGFFQGQAACYSGLPQTMLSQMCLPVGIWDNTNGVAQEFIAVDLGNGAEVFLQIWPDGSGFGLGAAYPNTTAQVPFAAYTSPFWMKIQDDGVNLSGKLWPVGNPEPSFTVLTASSAGPWFNIGGFEITRQMFDYPVDQPMLPATELQLISVEMSASPAGGQTTARAFKRVALAANDVLTLAVNSSASGTVQPTGTRLQVEPA